MQTKQGSYRFLGHQKVQELIILTREHTVCTKEYWARIVLSDKSLSQTR